MNMTHVHAFASAMQRKNPDAMLAQMADTVVLRTPLLAAPVEGKAAVRAVVDALLAVVDRFEVLEIMEGPRFASSVFKVHSGAEELDGVDVWRLDETGLIIELMVLWRPLPAIIAVERRLTSGG